MTTRPPHAIAVIINNDTFCRGFEARPGSVHDVTRLQEVLTYRLGYNVRTYKNLKREDIKYLFKSKIQGKIQAGHDSFFCCIMSHGGRDGIYGTDGAPAVSIADLMECLDGKNCRELLGKPKIMIFHCCRGDDIPEPQVYKAEGRGSQVPISPHSDFICAYSTVSGAIATLGRNGAPYIQALCDVMEKNDCSLNQMLCIVNRKLEEETGIQNVETKHGQRDFVQTGQVEHTLRDLVFFQDPK